MQQRSRMAMTASGLWLGLLFGFLLGHLDLAYRLLNSPGLSSVAWQEWYQALLIPALFFLFAFGIISLVITVSLPDRWRDATMKFIFLTVVFFVLLQLFIVQGILGQETLFQRTGVLSTALCLLAAIILTTLCAKIFPGEVQRSLKPLQSYIVAVAGFALSLLVYDSSLLSAPPKIRELVEHSSSHLTPNIVLITLDTVRPDFLSIYDPDLNTTPFLAELSQKAAVFEDAVSVSSWTLPSHASLFTGKNIPLHGAHARHQSLSASEETLAEMFQKAGYHTAGFVGGPFCMARYGMSQGFDYYHDRLDAVMMAHTRDRLSFPQMLRYFSRSYATPLLRSDAERHAPEINSSVTRWISEYEASGSGSPYFMFINYFDAHDPYHLKLPGTPRSRQEGRRTFELNKQFMTLYNKRGKRYEKKSFPEDSVQFMRDRYSEEIEFLDLHVGKLVRDLVRRAKPRDTLLIITADHGEEFFEHGGVHHAQTLYQEVIRVPLLITDREGLAFTRLTHPVSLIDIFPTLVDLAGLQAGQVAPDGISLAPLLRGKIDSFSRARFGSRFARPEYDEVELHSVIQDGWKFISADPERERTPTALFSLREDPGEQQNLIERNEEEAKLLSELVDHYQKDD